MAIATQPFGQGVLVQKASESTLRQRRRDRRDEKQDRREDRRDRKDRRRN
jgi:hypothetical protein